MAQKIKFKVNYLKTNPLHEDFIMEIPALNYKFEFDSYYLMLGKVIGDENHIISIINNYLTLCKKSILNLDKNQFLFLPIDFSDQYYGLYKITCLTEDLFKFEYGCVQKNDNIIYEETDNHIYFDILDEFFYIDFELQLETADIIDSFNIPPNGAEMRTLPQK